MENTDSRKHLLQLSITFLIFVIPSFAIELSDTFLFENSQFDFSFDRQRIAEGQWWRLLVGHFDHLSSLGGSVVLRRAGWLATLCATVHFVNELGHNLGRTGAVLRFSFLNPLYFYGVGDSRAHWCWIVFIRASLAGVICLLFPLAF